MPNATAVEDATRGATPVVRLRSPVVTATFRRCALRYFRLIPGANDCDAVIYDWTNAVRELEAAANAHKAAQRAVKQATRDRKAQDVEAQQAKVAADLEEHELMEKFREEFAKTKEADRLRFLKKKPKTFHGPKWDAYLDAQDELEVLQGVERELKSALWVFEAKEYSASGRVTAEHRDTRGFAHVLFPQVQLNMMLVGVKQAGESLWRDLMGKSYGEIRKMLRKCKTPQTVRFCPYYYVRDPIDASVWRTPAQLRTLGQHVPDPEVQTHALLQAARDGDAREMGELVAANVPVDAVSRVEATAVHLGACREQPGLLDAVFDLGGDVVVDEPDENGRTPLMYAAERGALGNVDALLRNGARVSARDRQGCTALHAAARGGHGDVVRLLLANGAAADVDVQDFAWGFAPCHFAARQGSEDAVRALMDAGADVYRESHSGQTAQAVAEANRHAAPAALLAQFVRAEPAHEVFRTPDKGAKLWHGSAAAATREWATSRGIAAIVTLAEPPVRTRGPAFHWLRDTEAVTHLFLPLSFHGEDACDPTQGVGWRALLMRLRSVVDYVHRSLEEGRGVLIHDEDGQGVSAAATVAYLVARRQCDGDAVLAQLRELNGARPNESLLRGIEYMEKQLHAKKLQRRWKKEREDIMTRIKF